MGVLRLWAQPDERIRTPTHHNLKHVRIANNQLGAKVVRRRGGEAHLHGRGQGKTHGRQLGTDERGQPLLPRQGDDAVEGLAQLLSPLGVLEFWRVALRLQNSP